MRDWLAIRAEATPEATALAAAGDVAAAASYADLDRRVEVLAGRLAARGVGVDDALAVASPTGVGFVELVHATQRLGATLVPLDPRLTAAEFATRLERVQPRAVVCTSGSEATVLETADAPVVTLDDPSAGAERLADVDPEPFDLPEWTVDDPLVVMFTSGTTGDPKGVVLTLANVLASATASAFRLGLLPDDCWHVTLPMHHMGGLAPVYRSVAYGTALSVQRGFDPGETLSALRAADATCLSVVPTMLERLLAAGRMPDLRFVLVGGAPCPPDLVERAHDRDVPVAPTYGMTETASQIATALPETAGDHPGTVGQPLVTTDLTVVDEAGDPVGSGERGEVVVDGPTVTPGYLDDSVTEAAVSEHGLHTGDLGYRDADGRLWITGRVDDAFVSGGETVHPEAVATRLRDHPAVHDAAVVGLPDREWGRRVAAALVPDGDVDPERVVADCAADLADYERPRTVLAVASLPRTASGTVDRDALRERLEACGEDV